MGDFNATVESPEMAKLFSELNLLDTYAVKNPDQKGFTWDPSKNSNTGYDASPFWANGVTPRDPLNTWHDELILYFYLINLIQI